MKTAFLLSITLAFLVGCDWRDTKDRPSKDSQSLSTPSSENDSDSESHDDEHPSPSSEEDKSESEKTPDLDSDSDSDKAKNPSSSGESGPVPETSPSKETTSTDTSSQSSNEDSKTKVMSEYVPLTEEEWKTSGILLLKDKDGTLFKKNYNLIEDDLNISFQNGAPADFVFYNDCPGTTLGDTSAASKLLYSIDFHATRQEKPVNYIWVLRSEGLKFNAYSLIPKNVPTLIIDNWEMIRKQKVIDQISKASVFISYPTFHYLDETDVDFLASLGPEYIRCTEYDFKESIRHPELRLFETGFKEGRLGIFMEQPSFTPVTNANLISDADISLRYLLKDLKWDKNNLYFGYFNRETYNELEGSWSDLINYAALASVVSILESLEKGELLETNIVIPATEEQFNDIKSRLKSVANSSHPLAAKVKPIIDDLKLEYIKLSKDKSRVNLETNSTPVPVIRIINPFPLAKENLLTMMQMSNSFSGLTGDQSFSEGLQFGKIPFYQIMHWKSDLHEYFTAYLKKILGESNNLVHFVAQLAQNSSVSGDFLLERSEEIFKYHDKWTQQMQQVSQDIYEHKNLKDTLAPEILSLVD